MTNAAIERRQGDALSQIVGTGDTRAALATLEQNVRDIIDVARDRGFVRSYGDSPHEFYGMPAWQLLGMTYGLVPFVEWTKPTDNGWEARAVVKTRDGHEVAAAEAMCTRTEGNRRNASDHTLRAMAQTRAQRNALRSALGAALVLAGFDFPDPDAPATKEQVAVLHILEREIGWDHDQGHVEAGDVASYRDLTREQASELIERWTALRDETSGERRPSSPDEGTPGDRETTLTYGEGVAETPTSSGAPATTEQWERAALHGLTGKKAVAFGKTIGINVGSASELTKEQLQRIFTAWLDRK